MIDKSMIQQQTTAQRTDLHHAGLTNVELHLTDESTLMVEFRLWSVLSNATTQLIVAHLQYIHRMCQMQVTYGQV